MIIEINNRTKSKINLKLVKRVVSEFARVHKIRRQEISIAFVGDAEIKKISFGGAQYRGDIGLK